MRKPRDFDAELKTLEEKARELKTRKIKQLGELVIATGAGALSTEELAGALLVLAETKDTAKREAWAKRGAAFFPGRSRRSTPAADRNAGKSPAQSGRALPPSGGEKLQSDQAAHAREVWTAKGKKAFEGEREG